jgi:hypothetical protein
MPRSAGWNTYSTTAPAHASAFGLPTKFSSRKALPSVAIEIGDRRPPADSCEADRLAFPRACQRVANVDGAPWIREQLKYHLAKLDGQGLDFYHLGGNVHRARRAVFGEDCTEGKAWAESLLHTFDYDAARQQPIAWRAQFGRSSKKRKAADRLLHYVSQRQGMIRYPALVAQGWQIGSGPTEAQCNLTVRRLKGRRRRWDRAAAAALESLERSGQRRLYWKTPCTTAA